ncbi:hypothetical protein [Kouleothrix sp.]|uniref:hypothetical protein n=1 Tax=Kouleothrix sp. TaxID=2779161 RepID=UPI00391C6917
MPNPHKTHALGRETNSEKGRLSDSHLARDKDPHLAAAESGIAGRLAINIPSTVRRLTDILALQRVVANRVVQRMIPVPVQKLQPLGGSAVARLLVDKHGLLRRDVTANKYISNKQAIMDAVAAYQLDLQRHIIPILNLIFNSIRFDLLDYITLDTEIDLPMFSDYEDVHGAIDTFIEDVNEAIGEALPRPEARVDDEDE